MVSIDERLLKILKTNVHALENQTGQYYLYRITCRWSRVATVARFKANVSKFRFVAIQFVLRVKIFAATDRT